MSKKEILIEKLTRKPYPRNFTVRELDQLMSKCNCSKHAGGRGSSIAYVHTATGRILQFDQPHPGNNLYRYQIEKTKDFLVKIGEL